MSRDFTVIEGPAYYNQGFARLHHGRLFTGGTVFQDQMLFFVQTFHETKALIKVSNIVDGPMGVFDTMTEQIQEKMRADLRVHSYALRLMEAVHRE